MRKAITLAALAGMAALSGLAGAQEPSHHFSGPLVWTDPAPAIYRIRAAGTDLCANRVSGALSTQLPHLELRPCATPIGPQSLTLSPIGWQSTGIPGPTPNPLDQPLFVTWRMTTPFNSNCLTAARGVVFGPPAIDETRCGGETGGIAEGAGDQLWFLVPRGPAHTFEIRDFQQGRCWTAQGGNARSGVQLVLERCDPAATGQQFVIDNPQADPLEANNVAAAVDFGWLPIPGRESSPMPFRFRAMPGTNLPSGDYTQGIETANDQGSQCAQLCAADSRCRAFTWVNPVQRGGHAMCYKKDTINSPVQDPFTSSGIIRP